MLEDYPSVKLQGLDKSVGRTVTFEATVGSTIQYGPLFIKIQACRKAPPMEQPESAAFLQIWEVPPGKKTSEWSFSGWMFASSPALSAMDHPVYDVWVLDCLGKEEPNEEAASAETNEEADQADLPAATAEGVQNKVQPTEEPIPTDSEAEPDAAPEPEDTGAPYRPDAAMPADPAVQPQQAPAPQDDSGSVEIYPDAAPVQAPQDQGATPGTAYEFMQRNRGTNAGPPPVQDNSTAYDYMDRPARPQPVAPQKPIY